MSRSSPTTTSVSGEYLSCWTTAGREESHNPSGRFRGSAHVSRPRHRASDWPFEFTAELPMRANLPSVRRNPSMIPVNEFYHGPPKGTKSRSLRFWLRFFNLTTELPCLDCFGTAFRWLQPA